LKRKIEIYATLGPSSLNKDFLKFANKNVSLLRVNMSHVKIHKLKKLFRFIKKFSKIPICLDTEGSQIRTAVKRKKFFIKNQKLIIFKNSGNFLLYPDVVFNKIKKNDLLNIGFDGLEIKVIKTDAIKLICKTTKSGLLDTNKGVHVINRFIKLDLMTQKDKQAILIAKEMGVKNFALSFTNSANDIYKFEKFLNNKNLKKIYKIETAQALKNLNEIFSSGEKFLIDRGDLSKSVSIEMIPKYQMEILKIAKIKKKKIYIATDFLNSMLTTKNPTIVEANDIYNSLKAGASGIVLAAETAIGKYPKETIIFLRKIIKITTL